MIRRALLGLAALALAAAGTGACTLLLPTDDLIKPCVDSSECDEGFECEENACLPVDGNDDGDAGEGEGEGEGE
jgi:hypothetical protein